MHSPPTSALFEQHLKGEGDSLGIGPLLPDDTCYFAAIDLDEPNFELAAEMMALLPGTSWLERSRSGNAHVLVFFKDAIEAWVPRGIMRTVLAAVGKKAVEVFPKTDHLLPGMVGNYLNLPYFGTTRTALARHSQENGLQSWCLNQKFDCGGAPVEEFVVHAHAERNDPADWRSRARWLDIPSPKERDQERNTKFGQAATLHICGKHLLEHRADNPVTEGHRASAYFAFSKMLANWSEIDDEEALGMLALVNDESPDPIPAAELSRIYSNAKRGEFTSTGCDDPLFEPYHHPDCKIGR